MTANTADTLLEFIRTELLDDMDDIETDENLMADGMVDSLGMMRMLDFIEQTFGISVPPEDMISQNFRTVERLVAYLAERGAGESA